MNKGYTKIPNELLDTCDLSIQARYLLCVLLRHNAGTGKCFPTQGKLGEELGRSSKQIRVILDELIKAKIITKRRRGFNRSNDYFISKKFIVKNLPATTAKNYTNDTKTYPVKRYKTTNHPNADDLLNSKREIVKDNIYFEKEKELADKMHGLFHDIKQRDKNKRNDTFSAKSSIEEDYNQKTKKPVSIREILESKKSQTVKDENSFTPVMINPQNHNDRCNPNPTPTKTNSNKEAEEVYAYVDSGQIGGRTC